MPSPPPPIDAMPQRRCPMCELHRREVVALTYRLRLEERRGDVVLALAVVLGALAVLHLAGML